jgi:hypothetical protein
MMGNFLLGTLLGSVIGVLVMALCAAQKMTESDYIARIDRVRKLATDTGAKAKKTDDAMGKAKAEGMWEAVKVLYGDQ